VTDRNAPKHTVSPERYRGPRRRRRALWWPAVFVICGTSACGSGEEDPTSRVDYGWVTEALAGYVEGERQRWDIPAMSIALVDGRETVWAAGFGEERPGVPASGETIYRVGSVSKLFTDIAVMQQVERGVLDLDEPVAFALPGVLPRDPDARRITLRHLMAHRSGLVREPPVGHYFDDSGASLEATVGSLSDTELIYPPGARTKYSNAGVAVVGRLLEVVTRTPFAPYLRTRVLEPMGMRSSAFEPLPGVTDRPAQAQMWTYHGVRFPAPTFELGMAPAGSMYTSVAELGRFLSVLFAEGEGPGGPVIAPPTLEAMWTAQRWDVGQQGEDTGPSSYGLGFRLFEVAGHRAVGHGGAIYGFSTELQALPDEGLGVAVVASLDGAGTVVTRIADTALRLMLSARSGGQSNVPAPSDPVGPELARRLDGIYGEGADAVQLRERDGELYVHPARGGGRYRLGRSGGVLVTDDVHGAGTRVAFDDTGAWIETDGARLDRAPDPLPPPPPEELAALVGEYGKDFNVLYIYEDGGRLRALIEWLFDYPLEQTGPDTFAFPDFGLYHGEGLVFHRDARGRPASVTAAGIVFPRRDVGTVEGVTFRIDPVRQVAELRAQALDAEPPVESGTFREPELVEVVQLDPTIRLDIRYASTNNFMGAVFYDESRAFLQRPAAEALVRAHRGLEEHGLGLLIHDGYRPWYVTKMFWDATPESQKVFVADPSSGSRHNRGAAVDLTLYDRSTGQPVRTVGGYDEFSPRSYPEYPGGTGRQRWYRELLRDVMEAEGFTVYEAEWWHFDFDDWRAYPILNARFDEIPAAEAALPGGS